MRKMRSHLCLSAVANRFNLQTHAAALTLHLCSRDPNAQSCCVESYPMGRGVRWFSFSRAYVALLSRKGFFFAF